eukprot:GHUV01050314.1.p2 GENE.GHUV01050314.1~~GHUV01050314.1.p2  ORF type:complete len:105 (-),score=28.49 GHUV01050314.1:336-650(-)
MEHLPEPAVQLWQKVVPLGLIFFCASFNLTILQVTGIAAKQLLVAAIGTRVLQQSSLYVLAYLPHFKPPAAWHVLGYIKVRLAHGDDKYAAAQDMTMVSIHVVY